MHACMRVCGCPCVARYFLPRLYPSFQIDSSLFGSVVLIQNMADLIPVAVVMGSSQLVVIVLPPPLTISSSLLLQYHV